MEKCALHSPGPAARNVASIAELFSQVITDSRNVEANVTLAVYLYLLRQARSDHVVENPQERCQCDWPGKRAGSFAEAPIAKTPRPVREESVGFETSTNLFAQGGGLEALKLLQNPTCAICAPHSRRQAS